MTDTNRPTSSVDDGHLDLLLGELGDKFVAALDRGESPSIDAIAADHPPLADIIRRTFPRLALLRHGNAPGGNAHDHSQWDVVAPAKYGPAGDCLGDFQLGRELGRGGMGVVYEAHQISLDRRVAVKVLPFASLWDDKRRRRFQLEAQTAAILQHPHIVSVHCVGMESGLHYYAMQIVDGPSLAELVALMRAHNDVTSAVSPKDESQAASTIDQQLTETRSNRPQEYYRWVASIGSSLAEALHYAHQQGIVHRDVKPSNILLDDHQHPWITDFGLARVHGSDGLTETGDVVGTLRYMSPEQFNGSHLVDHRADIYSLGATLYELATLKPAIEGTDSAEILRELELTGPRRPRSVDTRIPVDLETIILKAMVPAAVGRYQSAEEMADDLQCFLQGRPIAARRASVVKKLLHVAGNHKVTTTLGFLLVFAILTLAIVGPVVALRYARLAQGERDARYTAEAYQADLQKLLTESLTNTLFSLENTPGTSPIQADLIPSLVTQYEQLLARGGGNPYVRFRVGQGYRRLAMVASLHLGDDPISNRLHEASYAILNELSVRFDNDEYRFELGCTASFLAHELPGSQWQRKRVLFDEAITNLEAAARRLPDDPERSLELDYARVFYAGVLEGGKRNEEAKQLYAQAIASGKSRVDRYPDNEKYRLMWNWFRSLNLSTMMREKDFDKADIESADILRECEQLDGYIHSRTRGRLGYANLWTSRCEILQSLRRWDEAEAACRRGLAEADAVLTGFPNCGWARTSRQYAAAKLAQLLWRSQRYDEAEACLRKVLDISTSEFETTAYTQRVKLAEILWWSGRCEEATVEFQGAVEAAKSRIEKNSTRKQLALDLATCPDASLRDPDLARQLVFESSAGSSFKPLLLGIVELGVGNLEEAQRYFELAVVQDDGSDLEVGWLYLALTRCQRGEYDRSTAALKEADELLANESLRPWWHIEKLKALRQEVAERLASARLAEAMPVETAR